jgi:virulence factor Mce-like protein
MRGRGVGGALSGSPVLVGAVTVLVTIVAVFLSYDANSGLPFVPTYDLRANLPNAAELVPGNEVRIGGARVGAISSIEAKRRPGGEAYAQLELKLKKSVQPLPADSTILVRPRSALGLKYLEILPGKGRAGFKAGATVPVRQARPRPVEIDEVLNMFDSNTRRGAQGSLQGFGDGLAGRGTALNTALGELPPLLRDLEPVAADLSAPGTRLDRFFKELRDAAGEVAPVAEQQAELFVNLDTTFAALARVARPFIQETIAESPPTEILAISQFPRQRPFIRNTTALFRELRHGVATLPSSAPVLADALEIGTRTLPRTYRAPWRFNRRLADVFDAVADFSDEPLVSRGLHQLTRLSASLKPTLGFLTPAQTRCNYATLWFRNISSLLSEGDTNGTWQRFIIIATPQGRNNEGGPSSAPANGPERANYLHQNPYPNTAAPGQPRECEAGNEPYLAGRQVLGNVPGDQGLTTSGQRSASRSGAGGGR